MEDDTRIIEDYSAMSDAELRALVDKGRPGERAMFSRLADVLAEKDAAQRLREKAAAVLLGDIALRANRMRGLVLGLPTAAGADNEYLERLERVLARLDEATEALEGSEL